MPFVVELLFSPSLEARHLIGDSDTAGETGAQHSCALCRQMPSLLTQSVMVTSTVSSLHPTAYVYCTAQRSGTYHFCPVCMSSPKFLNVCCSGGEAASAPAYGVHDALDADRHIPTPNGISPPLTDSESLAAMTLPEAAGI